ncbi:alpha/beta hydrolase [Tepidiforma sp.]|uniref:alpha/beta fold hydrolase n=1 Tax=Tepidiforma sp. TaxID=2682230 RepID=UPI002ADDD696|nr:alpha/beta hydrolase [Tepidiforma sp.]
MIPGTTRRLADLGSVTLECFEAGEGPLIVLLHGFPELAFSWRHQVAPLVAAGWRVFVPNQRGYGASSAPAEVEAYDLEALAGDVAALIRQAGDGPAVVIGHDWGAPVAWHTARRYPGLVRAVGALSVPHAARAPRPPLELMRAAAGPDHVYYIDYFQQPGLAEAEMEADVRAFLLGFFWSISGDAPREERFRPIPRGGRFIDAITVPSKLPPWLSEADLQVYVDAFSATGFRGGLNWYRNVNRNWQRSADLASDVIPQPAFFVTGGRDPARNPPAIERLPSLLPDLRVFEILPGCGHWTQQERPAEVNDLLLRFLATL